MGAFTLVSVRSVSPRGKSVVITATGPSSYDTNGSTIDLSSAQTALAQAGGAFTYVDGVDLVDISSATHSKYHVSYVGSSRSPTAGKLLVRDLTAASDAEVSNAADLSAVTFTLRINGR